MNKPYIKKIHIIIEIITYLILLSAIVYAIIFATTTTGEVPTHFTLAGKVDGYGSPTTALLLPIMLFFTALIISLIMHFVPPSMMNLPVNPKPEREIQILSDMISMMISMNFSMSVFSLVETIAYTIASNLIISIATFVLLFAIFAFVTFFILKAIKDNK